MSATLSCIRVIPLKNTPLNSNLLLIRGGILMWGGGILIWSDPKNFRLRRAKNRVLGVFGVKKFPPAAGL